MGEAAFVLASLFQDRFPSCKSAKIMTYAVTGHSRGYGSAAIAHSERNNTHPQPSGDQFRTHCGRTSPA